MCRRPTHDSRHRKTHQPSECGDRHFRLAFRPDKIVAADIHRRDLLHLSSLSRPIFCFDIPSMFAPTEILACRQVSHLLRSTDALVASDGVPMARAMEVALLV